MDGAQEKKSKKRKAKDGSEKKKKPKKKKRKHADSDLEVCVNLRKKAQLYPSSVCTCLILGWPHKNVSASLNNETFSEWAVGLC